MSDDVNKWGPIVPILEIAVPSSEMRVDREKHVIRGVRILGPSSLNGRRYTPEAIQRAAGLYEDRPVNVDHPGAGESGSRRVADRFGWLKNVAYRNSGLEGDLHYLESHPQAAAVVEAAERNPSIFGLSHNADGRMVRKGQEYVVEEIVRVRSVDLVADPATTKSLFESLQEQAMDDMLPDPAPAGGETFDILVGKLRAIWDAEGDAKGKAGEINKLVRAVLKLEDTLSAEKDKPEDAPAEDAPADAPASESVETKQLAADLASLTESVATLTEKLAHLEERAMPPVDRPKSTTLKESTGDYQPPKDAKEFVARLKRR